MFHSKSGVTKHLQIQNFAIHLSPSQRTGSISHHQIARTAQFIYEFIRNKNENNTCIKSLTDPRIYHTNKMSRGNVPSHPFREIFVMGRMFRDIRVTRLLLEPTVIKLSYSKGSKGYKVRLT